MSSATCPECTGSGFETTINGQAIGRCRACKGVGKTCPQLGRLKCTQEPGHQYGCTYEAPDAPDGHDTSEAAAEVTRG